MFFLALIPLWMYKWGILFFHSLEQTDCLATCFWHFPVWSDMKKKNKIGPIYVPPYAQRFVIYWEYFSFTILPGKHSFLEKEDNLPWGFISAPALAFIRLEGNLCCNTQNSSSPSSFHLCAITVHMTPLSSSSLMPNYTGTQTWRIWRLNNICLEWGEPPNLQELVLS